MVIMSLCQNLVSSGEKLVDSYHYVVIQSVAQVYWLTLTNFLQIREMSY